MKVPSGGYYPIFRVAGNPFKSNKRQKTISSKYPRPFDPFKEPNVLNDKVTSYRSNSFSKPIITDTFSAKRITGNKHKSRENRGLITQKAMGKEVKTWLLTRHGNKRWIRNDGIDQLKQAVEYSFERLHSVKRGDLLKNILRNQTSAFHSPWRYKTVKRPSTSQGYSTVQNLSMRFFQNISNPKVKSRNKEVISYYTSALPHDEDDIKKESYKPYLKLYSLKELIEKVKENDAFSYKYIEKDSKDRLPAQDYINLLNDMCNVKGPIKILKHQDNLPLDYTDNFALNIIKSCQRLEKTKRKLTKNLVSTLNAQRDNRPCTVDSKKRSISSAGNGQSYERIFNRVRVNSEKVKIENYKELAKDYGKAYYLLIKFILCNDYENDTKVIQIMDYFKHIAECGEKFTEESYRTCLEFIGPEHSKPSIM